ncbi:MAG TPA: cytochrome P450, partial [Actinomycetes bacterium]|nr:cytochrome P450 [Actinomycetes bacterium]
MKPMPTSAIPGPGGPRMLMGIRQMRRSPPDFLSACARRYGSVVSFPIPRSNVVFISDPVDVKHVLQGNHTSYGKQTIQYNALAAVTGAGLLASDGEVWRRMRRTLQPAFHRGRIDDMAEAVQRPVGQWVSRWTSCVETGASQDDLDVDAEMLRLTLDVVGSTLFGSELGGRAASIVDAVSIALRIVVARSQQPFDVPSWMPSRRTHQLASALNELDAAVDRLVVERELQPPGTDALSLLLAAQRDGHASRQEVRNEIVTLIVAGHETVAATLTWTWLLLARHPDIEARVHDEVDALPPPPWGADVLLQLPLTRAVVDECLRLYPPAWVITRRALEPDVLGGYEIPADSTVIISPYSLHRDP